MLILRTKGKGTIGRTKQGSYSSGHSFLIENELNSNETTLCSDKTSCFSHRRGVWGSLGFSPLMKPPCYPLVCEDFLIDSSSIGTLSPVYRNYQLGSSSLGTPSSAFRLQELLILHLVYRNSSSAARLQRLLARQWRHPARQQRLPAYQLVYINSLRCILVPSSACCPQEQPAPRCFLLRTSSIGTPSSAARLFVLPGPHIVYRNSQLRISSIGTSTSANRLQRLPARQILYRNFLLGSSYLKTTCSADRL